MQSDSQECLVVPDTLMDSLIDSEVSVECRSPSVARVNGVSGGRSARGHVDRLECDVHVRWRPQSCSRCCHRALGLGGGGTRCARGRSECARIAPGSSTPPCDRGPACGVSNELEQAE